MASIKIERILCPVDFSQLSVEACYYASSLAQRYGSRLFVEHVVESWRHSSASFSATAGLYDRFQNELLSESQVDLQHFVESHVQNGAHPECVIRDGIATDCILAFAEEESVNLIVMGTHGRGSIEQLVLGSVTEKHLRKAHCPVLAVRNPPHNVVVPGEERKPVEMRRILFCTDLSEYSNKALDYALSLAVKYDSELALVHVLEDISESTRASQIASAKENLDRLISAEVKTKQTIEPIVIVGRAYEEINRLARETNVDLVIMATRGHNVLGLAMFGSTAYRVIHVGVCPVLAVHS